MTDPDLAASSVTTRPGARWREAAVAVHRGLTMLTLACIAVQFFLTGLGVFSRQRAGESDGYFGPHMALGLTIAGLTLLLAIVALAGRAPSPVVISSIVLFLLAGPVEPLLAVLGDRTSAWYGALHALTGVTIAALTGTLLARLRRTRPRSTARRIRTGG